MARVKWFDSLSFIKAAAKAGTEGLRETMEKVFEESQNQVPVDTGKLKSSGMIRESAGEVIASYGTQYAIDQHENLHYRHKNGKAKYLEDPFNQYVGEATVAVARRILRIVRK